MKTDNAKQSDLATLFGRSQAWVSNAQNRSIDPMPRDLSSARAWGLRNGIIGASHVSAPVSVASTPLFATAPPAVLSGSLEAEELRLKGARADLLELDRAVRTGQYLRTSEVEQREVAIASEFRHAACEYPLRARAILERLIPDAALVDRIVEALAPLAAELLNKSDARQSLAGKSRDEIRAALLAWVDTVMETIA